MDNKIEELKRRIVEKLKKGFTLVELLAVIVILAIIMLIAIPAVLNTLDASRRKSFIEYVDKVANLGIQKELNNELLSNASSNECTIYEITKDLDLSTTGDYKGYILVRNINGKKEFILTIYDDELMLRPYNYTNKLNYLGESTELSKAVEKYNESFNEDLSISNLCGYGCDECTTVSNEVISGEKKLLYDVLKNAAEEGVYAKEYTGSHQDSMNSSLSTQKIYYWYGTNETANEILEKNNVSFAGFCWKMVRTTDTGGIKMIYNGQAKDGKCLSSKSSQIIGLSYFNSSSSSIADVGYMYNYRYLHNYKDVSNTEVIKYSKSFTWDGFKYILNDTNSITFSDISDSTNRTSLNNAHYTCWNTSGECETLSYLYYLRNNSLFYINLNNGKSVEDAVNEMLYNDDVNKTDSTIKTYIDTWYENNLASYSNYLEDTIFCYDRSQSNSNTNGWNPNGGNLSTYMFFKNYNITKDLSCTNETDKFSTLNDKAKLKYKIGIMSAPEMNLLNSIKLRETTKWNWLGSPGYYKGSAYVKKVNAPGGFGNELASYTYKLGVRPAISLAPGTVYIDGDGSINNPYVIVK